MSMKFDLDNVDHLSLFNRLASRAAKHFVLGNTCYFSDCARDVEMIASNSDCNNWLWMVTDNGTCIEHRNAKDLPKWIANVVRNYRNVTFYNIAKRQTEYGTVFYDIEQIE